MCLFVWPDPGRFALGRPGSCCAFLASRVNIAPEVKKLTSDRNKAFVAQRMMDLVRLKKYRGVTQWLPNGPFEPQTVDTCFKTMWCWWPGS